MHVRTQPNDDHERFSDVSTWWRLRALVALTAIVLAACIPGSGPDEARSIAAAYLDAVAGEGVGRGWSLLHPVTRRDMFHDDADAYSVEASSEDWRSLSWSIASVEREDPNLYEVVFARDTIVPRFLTQHRGLYRLMDTRGGDQGDLTMFVRIDDHGGTGIWAFGG